METTRLFEQDNTDIVSDLRRITGGSAVTSVTARAADVIEALVKERDELKREMHARELHHFEEEQRSAGLAAEVERLRLVHAGQSRLALSAVFMADVDDDEGVQAFYREWVRNHDAALIESLIAHIDATPAVTWSGNAGAKARLTDRARQVREGEA